MTPRHGSTFLALVRFSFAPLVATSPFLKGDPYSANKLINRTGAISCSRGPLSKALSLVPIPWMLSKMSFRRGKKIPTRPVGDSGPPQSLPWGSCPNIGLWQASSLPSFTSQALALRGTSLSTQPVSVYLRGRYSCDRGDVYCSLSRFSGKGTVEAVLHLM